MEVGILRLPKVSVVKLGAEPRFTLGLFPHQGEREASSLPPDQDRLWATLDLTYGFAVTLIL